MEDFLQLPQDAEYIARAIMFAPEETLFIFVHSSTAQAAIEMMIRYGRADLDACYVSCEREARRLDGVKCSYLFMCPGLAANAYFKEDIWPILRQLIRPQPCS